MFRTVILLTVAITSCWCIHKSDIQESVKDLKIRHRCHANETYTDCASECGDSCARHTFHIPCVDYCRRGHHCECKEGYYRDPRIKDCVLPVDCPSEEYYPDDKYTRTTTRKSTTRKSTTTKRTTKKPKTTHKTTTKRPKPTRPHHDEDDDCCGDNEVYKKSNACLERCDLAVILCLNEPPVPRCSCRNGFCRNNDGDCVLKPPIQPNCTTCAENEEFSECLSACGDGCDLLSNPRICTEQCLPPGCKCKTGYSRDESGVCIPNSQCPCQSCGPNEEFSDCLSACGDGCELLFKPGVCTNQCLPPGCKCKAGYSRDSSTGLCIPNHKCRVSTCGPNEEFSECLSACGDGCDLLFHPRICTQQCLPPGCKCRQGFSRDSRTGFCIPNSRCTKPEGGNIGPPSGSALVAPEAILPTSPVIHPGICGPNEEFSQCLSACGDGCDLLHTPRVCTQQCLPPGCKCRKGFSRDSRTGLCVPNSRCSAPGICLPNEEFSHCLSACGDGCDLLFTPRVCTAQCLPPGCTCRAGYSRDRTGLCIPNNHCQPPQICGVNEEFSNCLSACGDGCDLLFTDQACTLQCLPPGCKCRPGFSRDSSGICIPNSQCPGAEPDCGHCTHPHEEFYLSNSCMEMCPNRRLNALCGPGSDHQGCFCQPGYCRNERNECVRTPTTPMVCGRPNEAISFSNKCFEGCRIPGLEVRCVSERNQGCYCSVGFCRKGNNCVRGQPRVEPMPHYLLGLGKATEEEEKKEHAEDEERKEENVEGLGDEIKTKEEEEKERKEENVERPKEEMKTEEEEEKERKEENIEKPKEEMKTEQEEGEKKEKVEEEKRKEENDERPDDGKKTEEEEKVEEVGKIVKEKKEEEIEKVERPEEAKEKVQETENKEKKEKINEKVESNVVE